jgi:hypothetical protein
MLRELDLADKRPMAQQLNELCAGRKGDKRLATAVGWFRQQVAGVPPDCVLRELPFVARFAHDDAEVFVDGAADIVFLKAGTWTIADYKFTDESPDELRRRYALQLAIYRAALFDDAGNPHFAAPAGAGPVRILLVRCGNDFQTLEIPMNDSQSPGKTACEVVAAARALRCFQQG